MIASDSDVASSPRQTVTASAPLLSADGDAWRVACWGLNGDFSAQTLTVTLTLSTSGAQAIQSVSINGSSAFRVELDIARASSSLWLSSCRVEHAGGSVITQGGSAHDLGTQTATVTVAIGGSSGNVRAILLDTRRA